MPKLVLMLQALALGRWLKRTPVWPCIAEDADQLVAVPSLPAQGCRSRVPLAPPSSFYVAKSARSFRSSSS